MTIAVFAERDHLPELAGLRVNLEVGMAGFKAHLLPQQLVERFALEYLRGTYNVVFAEPLALCPAGDNPRLHTEITGRFGSLQGAVLAMPGHTSAFDMRARAIILAFFDSWPNRITTSPTKFSE